MNEEVELKKLRDTLDAIDDEVLNLLNKRMETVHKVGELKAQTGGAIYRPEREKAIIDRLTQQSTSNNGSLNKDAIEALFLEKSMAFCIILIITCTNSFGYIKTFTSLEKLFWI